jgi:hypothetical protein
MAPASFASQAAVDLFDAASFVLVFDVLRPEFLDLLSSEFFYNSGLWSRRCRELYQTDSVQKDRAGMWFRVYMVHKWYERVVRSH